MGHRELGIELNRAFEQGHGRFVAFDVFGLQSQTVGLQRLERWGRRLLNRCVVPSRSSGAIHRACGAARQPPYRAPSEPAPFLLPSAAPSTAHRRCGSSPRRGRGRSCSPARDRAADDGRAFRALADFLINRRRDACTLRLPHQAQGLAQALVRHQAEERRLLELDRQCLFQCAVEDAVTGRVDEVGQDDRVLVGERSRLVSASKKHRRPRRQERSRPPRSR